MARSRNIKPGLFKNEILGETDPLYTILFAGLWTLADKEGRLEYRPKKIKAEIFPYRFDLDPCLGLDWLKHESFISVYEIDSSKYIQILNWAKHQAPHYKEAKSVIPAEIKSQEMEKVVNNQQVPHAQSKHGSSMDQATIKQNASCPTDSLNLIPDSLNLIPDSHALSVHVTPFTQSDRNDGKFQMTMEWIPHQQTWEANLFRSGVNNYTDQQLNSFLLHWSGETKFFTEGQWQGKLINHLKYLAQNTPAPDVREALIDATNGDTRSDWAKDMMAPEYQDNSNGSIKQ